MNAGLRGGINLFNQGRFFEAHETWEGLIQLAAACRLIEDFGEIKGPVKLIYQALIRLENYQPIYLDVKVADLAVAMEGWAKEIEASGLRGQKPVPTIAVRRFGFF
jgi:predicted metal-dependent hydrolase